MYARTDRYGMTVLHGDITQVQTLDTRVSQALAAYGVSSTGHGPLHTRACELVKAHPSLSAQQAVDYVLSKVTA